MSSSREGIPLKCVTMEIKESKPQTKTHATTTANQTADNIKIHATPHIQTTTTTTPKNFLLSSPPTAVGHESRSNDERQLGDDYFNEIPPGFRFCPTDEELIVEYLRKKREKKQMRPNRIMDVNLYRHNPQDLAETYKKYGEKEWYFFTPRDRKYKNGTRPNRAAGDGYWKATGADKKIKSKDVVIGLRKALVFYKGKPPRGAKTNWIMHEYRVPDSHLSNKMGTDDMQLDEWVLCRIYEKEKKSVRARNKVEDDHSPSLPQHEEVGMKLDYSNMQQQQPVSVGGGGLSHQFPHQPTLSINEGNGGLLPQNLQFNNVVPFDYNNIQAMSSVNYGMNYSKMVEPIFTLPAVSRPENFIWGDSKVQNAFSDDFWNVSNLDNVDLGPSSDFSNPNFMDTFVNPKPILPINVVPPTNNPTNNNLPSKPSC